MFQKLFAKYYDNIMQEAEEKGLREWRRTLLCSITGDVIELGAGTGVNLEFYSENISKLILLEPYIQMRKQLQEKLTHVKNIPVDVIACEAENIPFPDESFDYVVSTLVLCSVNNLEKCLSEIHRILRPDGKLIFIEHVAASNNKKRYQWQKRFAYIWKMLASNCHTARFTEEAILKAGFTFSDIQKQSIRGVPGIVRPSIRGVAVKI